jgi:uncharacterized membrane protein
LQRREWEQTSASQRRGERISRFVGRPAYLIGIMGFVAVWIDSEVEAPTMGWMPFDPPPFSILQGLLTLVALITTTIVLIAQNRQTKLEQHAHLDLQVNSASKFIDGAKGNEAHPSDGGITARFTDGTRSTRPASRRDATAG